MSVTIQAVENQIEDLDSGLGRKGEGEKQERRGGNKVYIRERNKKRELTIEGMSDKGGEEPSNCRKGEKRLRL